MCINCVCTSVTTTVVRPLVVNGCREIQSPSGMVRQGKTVRWWKKKEKKLPPGMIKLIPGRASEPSTVYSR